MRDEIYKETPAARMAAREHPEKARELEEAIPDFTHDHAIHHIADIILEFAEYDQDGNETKAAVMGGPATMIRDNKPEEDPDPPGLEKMTPRPATIVWL